MTYRFLARRPATFVAVAVVVAASVPASGSAMAGSFDPALTPRIGVVAAIPSVDWVETTDPPSGIRASLPGKAETRDEIVSIKGRNVDVRGYWLDTAEGGVGFTVHDMPDDLYTLEENLQRLVERYMITTAEPLTSSNVKKSTVDGRPVLDARLTSETNGEPLAGSVRLIADDKHFVQVLSLGPQANEKALKAVHERILAGLRIPNP
ncbi:hypothetical protein [Streptomyces sp. A0592]|uniref:hypothetical protein n=1 Tax=Streptomyces sp. A0592 TaxID=2563099 RepID=UPI00109ECBB9|nr:hypothetical protein [Streptomyces sp. A0592]THA77804.1 hypothetical protein E6U81_34095 [Streptomyces sp. A0592]